MIPWLNCQYVLILYQEIQRAVDAVPAPLAGRVFALTEGFWWLTGSGLRTWVPVSVWHHWKPSQLLLSLHLMLKLTLLNWQQGVEKSNRMRWSAVICSSSVEIIRCRKIMLGNHLFFTLIKLFLLCSCSTEWLYILKDWLSCTREW